MSDPLPHFDKRSLVRKFLEFLHPGPDSKDELIGSLAEAEDKNLIDADSRAMLEGVLRIADMTVGDIMVSAPRMDIIDIDAPFDEILHAVIDTAHSRFPVYAQERENIIGILMAKDLLKLQRAPELNIRALLRNPIFVPESKKINDLLYEFRSNRNHLALVIDEFGRTAGLVTIEDILEQIVGDIEDEFDQDDDAGDIYAMADGSSWRVAGDIAVLRIAEKFEIHLQSTKDSELEFDTLGGLITHELGRVPKRGEVYEHSGLRFTVLHSSSGSIKWFKINHAKHHAAL